jgi:hypothetical protein
VEYRNPQSNPDIPETGEQTSVGYGLNFPSVSADNLCLWFLFFTILNERYET